MSVGTYSGPGEDGPTVAYRAAVEGPGPGLVGVHGTSASYGPGTGSAYYPYATGAARNFPESDGGGMTAATSQRHQDTGAGHQSSCSVMDVPSRRHLVSSRYTGGCDDNLPCGGIYQPCGPQQHAQMMAAGDPNFVCSVWTPESGYASYVVDQRTGATIARSVLCSASVSGESSGQD